ncbi:hypothetical protein M0R45_001181 [Rubus argutus]|uniref:Uncharacterized protein n=1 Tax=Rubus argutus TaxID=59490 RepID=A0AAW1VIJ3_RUBAR
MRLYPARAWTSHWPQIVSSWFRTPAQRIKDAKAKLTSCWCNAYQRLFKSCSEIASKDNDEKKRFSWELSNCFQKDIGRPPFPMCREGSPMKDCLAKLDDNAIQTYRAFYLEAIRLMIDHVLVLLNSSLMETLLPSLFLIEQILA